MYAIIDIETTGGKYDEEGITEIAIYRYDGKEITDQFISLINPERPIQPFVVNLTGINAQMLRNAPKFYEIAKRVIEITSDCVLVAHNASFDSRILKTEFRRLGFRFEQPTLCTVQLSKKLIPNLPSYKLGKLVRSLGIPLSDRHRAAGDARATVELLKLLMSKDLKKEIISTFIKTKHDQNVPHHLLKLIDQSPNATGIYYLYDVKGYIIYIGKSKNIKKRLNQHFTGKNRKSLKIQLETNAVSFEETGNELIALLKEEEEIKIHKPKLNRVYKNSIVKFGLESGVNSDGYHFLRIAHADGRAHYVTTFKNINNARKLLLYYAAKYTLCLKLIHFNSKEGPCNHYKVNLCLGACISKEKPETYNERVNQLIKSMSYPFRNMLIIDKGRKEDEKSIVLIQNNEYQGFGYFNLNYQIKNLKVLESLITIGKNTRESRQIIQQYLRKSKTHQLINLDKT